MIACHPSRCSSLSVTPCKLNWPIAPSQAIGHLYSSDSVHDNPDPLVLDGFIRRSTLCKAPCDQSLSTSCTSFLSSNEITSLSPNWPEFIKVRLYYEYM